MSNCSKLKDNGVSISEDFSKRVLQCRKCLWESAKSEKLSGKKVRLVYDKLYVDGKAYYWDDVAEIRKAFRDARDRRSESSPQGSEKSS